MRNYLLCFLSRCFKGAVLQLVSRELLRSHSFSRIPVLPSPGRASVVAGRERQDHSYSSAPRKSSAGSWNAREGTGKHDVKLKGWWKKRHRHTGWWRPRKHEEHTRLMRRTVVPLWGGWDKEKDAPELPCGEAGYCTSRGAWDRKATV